MFHGKQAFSIIFYKSQKEREKMFEQRSRENWMILPNMLGLPFGCPNVWPYFNVQLIMDRDIFWAAMESLDIKGFQMEIDFLEFGRVLTP